MLRDHLIEAGVDPACIEVNADEQEAVLSVLQAAQRGDLVLIFGDNIARCWKQVVTFNAADTDEDEGPVTEATESALEFELPETFSAEQFEALIIDERGVRLAMEESAD